MPPEKLRYIVSHSGLNISTNLQERTTFKARAVIVAAGVGEVLLFNETILGVTVIALGLFADRRLKSRNRMQKEVKI